MHREERDADPIDDELAHPPPARPRSWWQTYGTSSPIWKIAAALFAGLFVLVAVVLLFFPRFGPPQKQTTCANHLRQFGGIFTSEHMEGRIPAQGGVPLLLSFRRKHYIQTGREKIFICPDDPDAHEPTNAAESALYDTVDLTDADALAALCSYAFRDLARYPIDDDGTDPETGEPAWIACDRHGRDGRTPHHRGGLNVLFADGAVRFKDRRSLGIPMGEPIVVGPDSPHPELRKMVIVPEDENGAPSETTPR